MAEMIYPPDCATTEARIALIDESIGILKSGRVPQSQIEHLDKVMTDESRLREPNPAVREKLFELRLVLDAHLPSLPNARKRRHTPMPLPDSRANRMAIREFRL